MMSVTWGANQYYSIIRAATFFFQGRFIILYSEKEQMIVKKIIKLSQKAAWSTHFDDCFAAR